MPHMRLPEHAALLLMRLGLPGLHSLAPLRQSSRKLRGICIARAADAASLEVIS